MEIDLGIIILYMVYSKAIDPSKFDRIPHELIKSSPVFYHLSLNSNIERILTRISSNNHGNVL